MTLSQAIVTWRDLQAHVTPEYLGDAARHALIHEILDVVTSEIRAGHMTYADFERKVAA